MEWSDVKTLPGDASTLKLADCLHLNASMAEWLGDRLQIYFIHVRFLFDAKHKRGNRMRFEEALLFLKKGKRIISKKAEEIFDQQWLSIDEKGLINYMNEVLQVTPDCILNFLNEDWRVIEEIE